jgi:cell division protease FtsH
VTTGAASDIQTATAIARRYVSQWGLSDTIGPVLVGDNEQEVFLGQQLTSRRVVSERTAQQVDDEVARVIDTAFQRAKKVLQENRPLLDAIAAALLERETLTREDFAKLIKGEELPPRPPSAIAPVTAAAPVIGEATKRVNPPLLGGPEPSPA